MGEHGQHLQENGPGRKSGGSLAIRLRYSQPDLKRSYRVPGGTIGMWCISGVGFAGVAFASLVGFFPPTELPVGSPTRRVGKLTLLLTCVLCRPILVERPAYAGGKLALS